MAKGYTVTWEIDVFDAASPRDAAQKAFDIMRKPDTTATVFHVIEHDDASGDYTSVDLLEEDNDDE